MKNEYTFKILPEEVSDNDLFEGKPHENIATGIHNLIKTSENGHTVGLQGQWGTGKSTIIKILEQKINGDGQNGIKLFYFDAWEHEGDPLRRIFLESLINDCGNLDEAELAELKDTISKKKTIKNVTTKRSASRLGTLLGIGTLCSPLGIGLLSASNTENLTIFEGQINWLFSCGLAIAALPIIVVICWAIPLSTSKQKSVFSIENWPLIQNQSEEKITNETSIEEDNTSIEFERYFDQIVTNLINNGEKLVLIIDNLDRINPEDALTIWSTLQTYLQHRNPLQNQNNELYKRIWTIVPYDERAMSKVWDPNYKIEANSIDDSDSKENSNSRAVSKSFFEKSFQLHIDVPRPTLTSWENLLNSFIDKALIEWPIESAKKIVNVFKYTRVDLAHNPTPRELKTYINQIGLLRSNTTNDIPTDTIAYYVIKRYLERKSTKEITEELIKGNER